MNGYKVGPRNQSFQSVARIPFALTSIFANKLLTAAQFLNDSAGSGQNLKSAYGQDAKSVTRVRFPYSVAANC
jgi:hypothetical protein